MSAALSAAATMMCAGTPQAHADATLSPGDKITIGESNCSLGFFATNVQNDPLAVTAGHCADNVGQDVMVDGNRVGIVAALMRDNITFNNYGIAVLRLSRRVNLQNPVYTAVGNPVPGDHVTKYGYRTGVTDGTVLDVNINPLDANNAFAYADLYVDHGDSGGPWVVNGRLAGIEIGARTVGGQVLAVGFPIDNVIAVARTSQNWGIGFDVIG